MKQCSVRTLNINVNRTNITELRYNLHEVAVAQPNADGWLLASATALDKDEKCLKILGWVSTFIYQVFFL